MALPAPIRRAALVGSVLALVGFALLASGGSPSRLVERGPFTSDFFDAQAHALVDGRLDVDPRVAGIEGFEHEGRTYLYFGLMPAVLRLPIAAATDSLDGRLSLLSMLVALAVALWATSRLLWRGRLWQHDDELRTWEPAAFGFFVAAAGLASPLLFLSARAVVYHEAILWGSAMALVALDRLLHWWDAPRHGPLAVASITALLALHCRAPVGVGAVAAIALTGAAALLWRHAPWRHVPALALAVIVPVASYAMVNQARFDHPFSVPFESQAFSAFDANRQATLESTGGGFFGAEFAPTTIVGYLRPDGVRFQSLFPWVTFRESTAVIGNPVFDTMDRSSSLPIVAPLLLVLAAIGVVARIRRRSRDPWLAAAAGMAAGLVLTVTIAFIANRYLADFTPALVLPACLGLWVAGDAIAAARPAVRRLAVGTGAAVVLVSCLTSSALALQSQRLFVLPDASDRRGFVGLQYDLDGAWRDGAPTDVRQVPDLPPPADGERGDITIVGDCRALYWHNGRQPRPLEIGRDLGFVLRGEVPEGRSTLLVGDGWDVTLDRRGDELRLAYASGEVVVEDEITVAHDDPLELTVTLDPPNHELVVSLDGRAALHAWPVGLPGPIEPGPGWTREASPTPLCDQLADRLDD